MMYNLLKGIFFFQDSRPPSLDDGIACVSIFYRV